MNVVKINRENAEYSSRKTVSSLLSLIAEKNDELMKMSCCFSDELINQEKLNGTQQLLHDLDYNYNSFISNSNKMKDLDKSIKKIVFPIVIKGKQEDRNDSEKNLNKMIERANELLKDLEKVQKKFS